MAQAIKKEATGNFSLPVADVINPMWIDSTRP